ncbi:MAG TPA: decaprenyl-phosphate phosphoribosyltransferase [Anaeromyxobacteraceae bacterium]|nr:decaprenyl-phosphate phosphoribosyltransferase [Anaeromyxobacteraceae bacterium]
MPPTASSADRGSRGALRPVLVAMRPTQWLKNLAVAVAPVFALKATDPRAGLRVVMAFAAFSLLSSATYLVNDLADRERDRAHPDKRLRPVASGELPAGRAALCALALLGLGLFLALSLGETFLLTGAGYLVLQAAYTVLLRGVAILDVFAIAGGFVLRVVAGAEAVHVPVSNWLYLTTLFLALFLALEKRRAELVRLAGEARSHRDILAEYSVELLDQLVAVASTGTIVTYSLYTLAPDTLQKFGTDRLRLTIPFVLFGVFRYLHLSRRRGAGGQPERVLLRDRGMQLTVVLFAAVVAWAIYTRRS